MVTETHLSHTYFIYLSFNQGKPDCFGREVKSFLGEFRKLLKSNQPNTFLEENFLRAVQMGMYSSTSSFKVGLERSNS